MLAALVSICIKQRAISLTHHSVTGCLVDRLSKVAKLHLSASLHNSVDKIFSDQRRLPLSLCVVSRLCRLSLKMLLVMFGMAHSVSRLLRAPGLGESNEGRALNKRIMKQC